MDQSFLFFVSYVKNYYYSLFINYYYYYYYWRKCATLCCFLSALGALRHWNVADGCWSWVQWAAHSTFREIRC